MKKTSSHYIASLLVAAFSPALISGSCTQAPMKAMGVATLSSTDASGRLSDVEGKQGEIWEQYYKFIVWLDASGKPKSLVYQNNEKYEFHSDYLMTLPEFQGLNRKQIDEITYKPSANRKVLLGVLVKRAGDDGITSNRFNLVMEDAPTADTVASIHSLILKSLGSVDELNGAPLNLELLPHQVRAFAAQAASLAAKGIGLHVSERVQDNVSYTDGWRTGTLAWVSSEDELNARVASGEIGLQTIVVTDQNLRELPSIAGLISAVPLTPASHSVLLGQMYGLPIVYHKDAEKIFKPLVSRKILLNSNNVAGTSGSDNLFSFLIDPKEEDLKKLSEFVVRPKLDLVIDTNESKIRQAAELDRSKIPAYGGKASQIGLLMKTIPQNTLDKGVGIPVHYFKKFMTTAKARTGETLEAFVAKSLATVADPATSETQTKIVLKAVRDEIKAAKIPADIVATIRAELSKTFPGDKVRLKLRSSSNAEDGETFNGAGLYDSEGIWLTGGEPNDLEKGLNKVWRSVYTDRGFIARRRFKADESKVGMAILAQKTFKGELANGVIVFHMGKAVADPSDMKKDVWDVKIITHEGEEEGDKEAVTHGTGKIRPEIMDVNSHYEVFSRLQQPFEGYSEQRTILPKEEYHQLGKLMRKVAASYGAPSQEVTIESEFKVMPDGSGRKLVIKQVRPVPKPKLVKAQDGSRYMVVTPKVANLRTEQSCGNSFGTLWCPRNSKLVMKSFTDLDIASGKLFVEEFTTTIQGKTYSVKKPKIKLTDRYEKAPGKILNILVPNERLPSLTVTIEVPYTSKNVMPLNDAKISMNVTTTDEKDLVVLRKIKGHLNRLMTNLLPIGPETFLSDFDKDEVVGTNTETLKTKGAKPLTVVLSKMKLTGEGDNKNKKIGEAQISGLLSRPIKVTRDAIAYYANHHSGLEDYTFDLLTDASLTRDEKSKIEKMGRYLLIDVDWEGANVYLLREDGHATVIGQLILPEGSGHSGGDEE